ncbi:HepT-like ribonuclease domain-containing protein [Cellulomonas hominis]
MTPDITDERALHDLARFGATAAKIVQRGREAFLDPEDEILRYAGRTVVVNVSAALDRLSPSLREQFPDVPWRAVRDLPNYTAHAYDHVNYDHVNDRLIWEALTHRIPDLVRRLTTPAPPLSS